MQQVAVQEEKDVLLLVTPNNNKRHITIKPLNSYLVTLDNVDQVIDM